MHYTHAIVVYLYMYMCSCKQTSAEINKKQVRQHTDDDVARTRENKDDSADEELLDRTPSCGVE